MIFVEFRFILFFLVVFCIYWTLRKNAARKSWLLLCSYFFYGSWNWKLLGLIILSTLVDYFAALRIEDAKDIHVKKKWLFFSIVSNLGMLGIFKYLDFFIGSASDLTALLGLPISLSSLNLILPVGISFYTFQTLSYSIDVYRGKRRANRHLLDVALFVGFFPQLVAGPIVRARSFLPQLKFTRRFTRLDFRYALVLFLVGFFKKACVADNLAFFVDRYYSNPEAYNVISSWMAVTAYAVQLYCDFSGYSDMAIALAGLLGYRLCKNFDFPYFAANISEFWRRWHISLSSWFRDYLYRPLAIRSGPSNLMRTRNIFITMLLCGLWHGAGWNFIVWGFLQAVLLTGHRLWQSLGIKLNHYSWKILSIGFTFYIFCVTLIPFRAPNWHAALVASQSFIFFHSHGTYQQPMRIGFFLVILSLLHLAAYKQWLSDQWKKMPTWGFAAAYGFACAVTLALAQQEYAPFIYFQF